MSTPQNAASIEAQITRLVGLGRAAHPPQMSAAMPAPAQALKITR